MYCSKCGAEIGNAKYCPVCGTKQDGYAASFTDRRVPQGESMFYPEQDHQETNGRVADFLGGLFSDTMFMLICILMTVATALSAIHINSVAGTVRLGFEVISLLIVVSLWITYGSAKSGRLTPTGPSFTSGVLLAMHIIYWIGAIALIVGGILILIGSSWIAELLPGNIKFYDIPPEVYEQFRDIIDSLPQIFNDPDFQHYSKIFFIVIGVVMLVGAVVMIIINQCFIRKLHTFAKSVSTSLKTGSLRVEKANACRNWLIVSAVFSLLGGGLSVIPYNNVTKSFSIHIGTGAAALSSVAALCSAAACILASVMINRYLIEGGDSTY